MSSEAADNSRRSIIKIAKDVSSRICTAQVVVSLSGAVRQLVDNCIDAGAKIIDVRMHANGCDSLEVIDDGSGIEEDDFSSLCQAHSTSKLTQFSDFDSLSTLGFRGEALNALCALSSVTIITRSSSSLLGTKLCFDHNGMIVSQTSVARPIGTTVLVENLFETLPVRRKEFVKTSKREMGRVLSCIQCFALSRPEIRFICSNFTDGSRKQLICTPGSSNIKEVVVNLFGGRSDRNKMLEITRTVPDELICNIYGLSPNDLDVYESIQIDGFLSSCEKGYGRSATDRQFIYINNRPVDYPKVCRAVNEVYQQYNRSQFPTLVLFIQVPPESIDVNITPDKRTVLYEKEKHLVALVRASAQATFQPLLGTVTSLQDKGNSRLAGATDGVNRPSSPITKGSGDGQVPSVFDLLKSLTHSKKRVASDNRPTPSDCSKRSRVSEDAPSASRRTLDDFAFKKMDRNSSSIEPPSKPPAVGCSNEAGTSQCSGPEKTDSPFSVGRSITPGPSTSLGEKQGSFSTSASVVHSSTRVAQSSNTNERNKFTRPLLEHLSRGFENNSTVDDEALERVEARMKDSEKSNENVAAVTPAGTSSIKREAPASQPKFCSQLDDQGNLLRPQQKIPFSMAKLRERLKQIRLIENAKSESKGESDEFSAGIRSGQNEIAEKELTRVLCKADFAEMSIVGQFNHGFIVTRLRDNLFIIDQHASDEKYNFERFQRKAHVETQKLISPLALDFGAVQESVLRDNLQIFRLNGFEFEFRDNEDGGSRAYVTCIPVLHSWQFDKNDIDEILAVVTEFPGEMYRPSKLRRIFASRACRKSVMIGTPLNRKQMETIVLHLGTLEQPWNCPHGRPTLRHLMSLS